MTRIYARIRHPQYVGFVLVMFGFLLQWPTLLTLAMFPVLVFMYVQLARSEEREAIREFGDRYRAYMAQVPAYSARMVSGRQGARLIGQGMSDMGMGDWMLPGAALVFVVVVAIVSLALDDIVTSVLRRRRGAEPSPDDEEALNKAVGRSWRSKLRRRTNASIRRSSRLTLPRRQSGR